MHPSEFVAGASSFATPHASGQATCGPDDIQWVSSSDRIYVSGDVRCTLSDIRRYVPENAPLALVDATSRTWLLGADLVVQGGATLVLDGSPAGDVGELRLRSDPGPTGFVELRAEWGDLVLDHMRVTSWDSARGGPDVDPADGRAFIRAVSFEEAGAARESRMDVTGSDIGFLGYYAAESYGLVWKVRGDTLSVFDRVDVWGDVTGSTIHDNYFGMYTFGAYGMHIADNVFADNVGYGVDPHDDSDALLVERKEIYGNGDHGFICSKRCDTLVVRGNVSHDNGGVGFMFHAGVTGSILEDNLAERNATGGFAIVDSVGNVVRNNAAHGNEYGIRLSVGASDNKVQDNDFGGNIADAIYLYKGEALPTLNDGRPRRNTFVHNRLTGSEGAAVRLTDADDNVFIDDTFGESPSGAVTFEDACGNVIQTADLGGGALLAEGLSADTVRGPAAADVSLLGPDAALTFEDPAGRVYTDGLGTSTYVGATGTALTLGGEDTEKARVEARDLFVTPNGGDLWVAVTVWTDTARAWNITPGTAATVRFRVAGLVPAASYRLRVDGVASLVQADQDGAIVIDHAADTGREFQLDGGLGETIR